MGRFILAALLILPLFGATVIDLGSPADAPFCTGGTAFPISIPGATGDLTVRSGPFSCSIPAPAGQYAVTLGLRETGTVSAAGKRSFGVKLNDQPVLDKFDLFAAAGLQETKRTYSAWSSGTIRIDATHTPGTAKTAIVAWVSIEPISSGGTVRERVLSVIFQGVAIKLPETPIGDVKVYWGSLFQPPIVSGYTVVGDTVTFNWDVGDLIAYGAHGIAGERVTFIYFY